jgi:hypothetical protein
MRPRAAEGIRTGLSRPAGGRPECVGEPRPCCRPPAKGGSIVFSGFWALTFAYFGQSANVSAPTVWSKYSICINQAVGHLHLSLGEAR